MCLRRDGDAIRFDAVEMAVKARRQEPDPGSRSGLRDVPVAAGGVEADWADRITRHYDEYAQESPSLERVQELAKAVAVAKWLEQRGVALDQALLADMLRTDRVSTPDQLPALSVEWDRHDIKIIPEPRGLAVETAATVVNLFGGRPPVPISPETPAPLKLQ